MEHASIVTPEADVMRFIAYNKGQSFKIFTETSLYTGKFFDIAVLSEIEGIASAHFDDGVYGYGVVVSKKPGYSWLDSDDDHVEKCNLLSKCLDVIASFFGKKSELVNLEDYCG